jgi:hypothetical protein
MVGSEEAIFKFRDVLERIVAQKIVKGQSDQTQSKVHELLDKHNVEDPVKVNAKRERFLALLKSRYGYSNDTAVDELERLLKQFYRSNKSLNIHLARPSFIMQVRSNRKKRIEKPGGGLVD